MTCDQKFATLLKTFRRINYLIGGYLRKGVFLKQKKKRSYNKKNIEHTNNQKERGKVISNSSRYNLTR